MSTQLPNDQTQLLAPSLAPGSSVRSRGRNVLAVASGKGGVGKTWFSITLAHALALRGRKTLLFDGDLGLANVDIQLGLMPKLDLGSVVTGKVTLTQACSHYDRGGFDVIAGRSGSGSLANIPLSRLQLMAEDLSMMATAYHKVIIDLGAGVEKSVRQLARAAGTILVVTSDEPTSLTDAYAFIKVTALERPGADIRVVVNAANSTREGERTYATLRKACEGFLKFSPPLVGIVRRDMRVREAIRNQTPILIRSPNAEAAMDVEAIADKLLAD
ncbi:MinD/ParA family protein [Novispirillum itersonii]|uniref:MinD/ParA family protein n=1 Tax=Novispirillum itersonii TaxID=189 RepID=UPI00036393AA|nr:MinD/ParA family protein [Novispirillum itersonii]